MIKYYGQRYRNSSSVWIVSDQDTDHWSYWLLIMKLSGRSGDCKAEYTLVRWLSRMLVVTTNCIKKIDVNVISPVPVLAFRHKVRVLLAPPTAICHSPVAPPPESCPAALLERIWENIWKSLFKMKRIMVYCCDAVKVRMSSLKSSQVWQLRRLSWRGRCICRPTCLL